MTDRRCEFRAAARLIWLIGIAPVGGAVLAAAAFATLADAWLPSRAVNAGSVTMGIVGLLAGGMIASALSGARSVLPARAGAPIHVLTFVVGCIAVLAIVGLAGVPPSSRVAAHIGCAAVLAAVLIATVVNWRR